MQENILGPLGMTSSGFDIGDFAGRQVVPHTRIDGANVQLPVWRGNGYMMRTTAEDMARFLIAQLNGGRYGSDRLLEHGSIESMREVTTGFRGRPWARFHENGDLRSTGHGLGLEPFAGGWYGFGGSTVGFQCLWRFHPSRQVGYVILTNVNAILAGGDNHASARGDVYAVQSVLIATLDPPLAFGLYPAQLAVVAVLALVVAAVAWGGWRAMRARG